MKRAALYSSSRPRQTHAVESSDQQTGAQNPTPDSGRDASAFSTSDSLALGSKPERRVTGWALIGAWGAVGLLVIASVLHEFEVLSPVGKDHSRDSRDMRLIEDSVRKSLEEKPLVPPVVTAARLIAPSVVRVVGLAADGDASDEPAVAPASPGPADKRKRFETGVGSGVVIIDDGTILTNLHVLQGAKRIKVTFADGHVSDALLAATDRKNDLAVLRPLSVPDDLQAAAMRSTADLVPGEPVMAVGFPFGIGPSHSLGVVSGLKREFRSPDGEQVITNLIQFDAAANPGNSGGPLITMDGAVVGIVTAILNPTEQRFFIGIGFAVPIENAVGAAGMPPF